MNVYVENILAKGFPTATNRDIGYVPESLYDETLSSNVVFTGPSTVITAAWGLNKFADTIAILDSNWLTGRLILVSQGTTVYDKPIARQGKHTIVKLPEMFMLTEMTLELKTLQAEKLSIGILFVGRRIELPLFNVGFKYGLNMNSKPERTRYGVVYGSKKTSLRTFSITYSDIDNTRRLVMEDYIDAVQYVQPHLVEPYETREFQPIYATLTDAGGFDKGDDWRWDTKFSYMEAK